jgi:protein-L-isoaspartate(D-aspartate) O-methyltransferase
MGIRDGRVLRAFEQVPRQLFVPPALADEAESDRPLPIGHGQTISQPFIVAFMTEALRLTGDERVLEVGTGSGYQTAILARLAREVYSVEIVPELSERAGEVLHSLGVENVELRVGDGRAGWPEEAPFDAIVVTAAPAAVPEALVGQLAPGGRLVIPVGADPELQDLVLVVRGGNGVTTTTRLLAVRFVPLTGGAA